MKFTKKQNVKLDKPHYYLDDNIHSGFLKVVSRHAQVVEIIAFKALEEEFTFCHFIVCLQGWSIHKLWGALKNCFLMSTCEKPEYDAFNPKLIIGSIYFFYYPNTKYVGLTFILFG